MKNVLISIAPFIRRLKFFPGFIRSHQTVSFFSSLRGFFNATANYKCTNDPITAFSLFHEPFGRKMKASAVETKSFSDINEQKKMYNGDAPVKNMYRIVPLFLSLSHCVKRSGMKPQKSLKAVNNIDSHETKIPSGQLSFMKLNGRMPFVWRRKRGATIVVTAMDKTVPQAKHSLGSLAVQEQTVYVYKIQEQREEESGPRFSDAAFTGL